MATELLKNLRKELKKVADPVKAPQMQAYMKSEMPYHGVPSPAVKKIAKAHFPERVFTDRDTWASEMMAAWHDAKFREERYLAIAIAGDKRAREFQAPAVVKHYEDMIVTGAWWDYVDAIASHQVGPIVRSHPKVMHKRMLSWSKGRNMWKRRTAILCQLSAKDDVDYDLLFACIEPSLGSSEFFLQKAIGWALRQVAWSDPATVIRYVKQHRDELAPLSKREAVKNLLKSGQLSRVP